MSAIQFGEPELDFSRASQYGEVVVTLRVMHGSVAYYEQRAIPQEYIGTPHLTHLVRSMHHEVVDVILSKLGPTRYTIKERR